jgi:hypothetical protein
LEKSYIYWCVWQREEGSYMEVQQWGCQLVNFTKTSVCSYAYLLVRGDMDELLVEL